MKREGEAREITEAQVIAAIRDRTFTTLRECSLYIRWMEQEERKIEENTRKDGRRGTMANFKLILRDARLRREAGLKEAARYAYEDALEYTEGILHIFGDTSGMIERIQKEMNEMQKPKTN